MEKNTLPTQTDIQNETDQLTLKPQQGKGRTKIVIGIGALFLVSLITASALYFRSRTTAQQENLPNNATVTPVSSTTPTPTQPTQQDTSAWETYSDPNVGLSFRYPKSILFNEESKNSTRLALFTSIEKLSDIPEELPMGMGRNDALQERDRLAQGSGDSIVKIGSVNGEVASTYAQFEVCSVLFIRKLTFYTGDYRVILSLSGPREEMINSMPTFFVVDAANCGSERVWDRDKMTEFEDTLKRNQGSGMAQEWYNTFDTIVETIELTDKQATDKTSIPNSGSTYTNNVLGFQLTYDKPYRLLTDADNLSGYPQGVALLYTGGQAYDIVIEAWDNKTDYENKYSGRLSDVTMVENKGKFITLLNNTHSSENQKIIQSIVLLP